MNKINREIYAGTLSILLDAPLVRIGPTTEDQILNTSFPTVDNKIMLTRDNKFFFVMLQ